MIRHEQVHEHFEIWSLEDPLRTICESVLDGLTTKGSSLSSIESSQDTTMWYSHGDGFATVAHSNKDEAIKRAEWIAVSIAQLSALAASMQPAS